MPVRVRPLNLVARELDSMAAQHVASTSRTRVAPGQLPPHFFPPPSQARPSNAPAPLNAPPSSTMTTDKARTAAAAEGLESVPSSSSGTGFKGVSRSPRSSAELISSSAPHTGDAPSPALRARAELPRPPPPPPPLPSLLLPLLASPRKQDWLSPRGLSEHQLLLLEKEQTEWCAGHSRMSPRRTIIPESTRDALQRAFHALDTNGNGSLSLQELKEPLQSIGITDTREAIAAVHCTIDDELDLDKFCALILNANAAARKRERTHERVAPSSVKSSAPPCEPFSALTDPDRFPFGMVVNSNRISRMVDESMKRSTRRAARLSTESVHPLRRKVTFQLPAI